MPPVSPCGLAVDLLRTCYTQQVRFYKDTDELTTIRWYFTDAPPLPVPTIYSSYVWDDDNGPRGGMHRGTVFQGEQLESLPVWNNGLNPPVAGNPPGHYCGTPEQWLGELEMSEHGEAATDEGRPTCCGSVPVVPLTCENSTNPTAQTYTISCAVPVSGSRPVAALGGAHQVERDSSPTPCSWTGLPVTFVPPILRWRVTVTATNFLRVGFLDGATFRVLGTVADWVSDQPVQVDITTPFGGTWPPSLDLTPSGTLS